MDAPWIDGPPDWPNIRTADDLRQCIGCYGEDALDLYDIRFVECERCGGLGDYDTTHQAYGSRSCPEPYVNVKCEACSGSGVVETETRPVECDEGQ